MHTLATAAPGSPTVPPLAGWQGIVVALLAVLVVGVAFLVIGALATATRRRSPEWEAWLHGRSRNRFDLAPAAPARPADDGPDAGVGLFGARPPR
ncbi:hypothetical protein SAMN05660748_2398 [Blastococcus aggregatus]|uniref:Uncharacterized protein n=1 Tax=Blastococcus aggregatus TaxID=38502 RepID=A0A285V6W3_9ACTN|nr:hypothetical protein [Blastococcus aggregatus]SOC49667.1 hypothetical protein SAMN05660748_2398 [Blastococcus aggregatus]